MMTVKVNSFDDSNRFIGKHKAAWRATIQLTVKMCRDFAFGFHPPLGFSLDGGLHGR